MTTLHTDHPIDGSDEKPDLLGREQYASNIGKALLLKKDAPGIVASIEGEWGYGKTSFLNLIKKHFKSLSSEEHPIIVDFNPWMVSGAENLVQEFLVQLASKIGASDLDNAEKVQSAAKQVLSYSEVFTVFKFIPEAEPKVSIVKGLIDIFGGVAKAIGKLKELSIEDKRDKTVKAIGSLGKPFVVFIDDIDRLPPNEVFDTIRLVKAVADFPRVSFVLAYDQIYVLEALSKFGIKDGLTYMEKIVQWKINLPAINFKDIEKLISQEYNRLPEEARADYFPDDSSRLASLYQSSIKFLLDTPRDVKRLFNNLRLNETFCRAEVALSDLFALEVIALKAPLLYADIKKNMANYIIGITDQDLSYMEELVFDEDRNIGLMEEKRKSTVKNYTKEGKEEIWHKLLNEIFPLRESDIGDSKKSFYSHGRIAAKDRLLVALYRGIPSHEISMDDVKNFMENDISREKMIESIDTSEKIERFVDVLLLLVDATDVHDQEDFIRALTKLAEDNRVYEFDESHGGPVSVRLLHKLWWVLEAILEKADRVERIDIIKNLVSNYEYISLGTEAFNFLLTQHDFYASDCKVGQGKPWCAREDLVKIEKIWKESVQKVFDTELLFSVNSRSIIIYILSKLDTEMAKNLIGPMISDDKKIDEIVMAFGRYGSDSTKGDYSYITNDFLELIGNPDEIKARARARLDSDDPPQLPLLAIYKSIDTGKKFYLVDGSEGEPNWS